MTRIALLVVVVTVTGLALTPAAAGQPEKERATVVCSKLNSDGTDYVYRFAIEPRRCIYAGVGDTGTNVAPVNWKQWGVRSARGVAKNAITVDGRQTIKVRLSKPVDRCGGPRFSVARFVVPDEPRFSSKERLRTCI